VSNTDRNDYPPGGGLNMIYLAENLNIQADNAFLGGKVSRSGQGNDSCPRWSDNFWSEDVLPIGMFQLPARELRSV